MRWCLDTAWWIFNIFPHLSLFGSWWHSDGHTGSATFQSSSSHSLSAGTTHPAPVSALNLLSLRMKFEFLIISVRALFWDTFHCISQGFYVGMWHLFGDQKEHTCAVSGSRNSFTLWAHWECDNTDWFSWESGTEGSLFSVMGWIPVIELVHSEG